MVPAVEVPPRYVKPMIKQARERDESFKNYETYKTRIEEEVRHPEMHNLIGAIGELAFAEYADIQMDTDIYQAGDTGADFHVNALDDEMHIDVKTRSGDLFAFWVKEKQLKSAKRESDADYYVLAKIHAPVDLDQITVEDIDIVDGWKVEFLGGASREELLNGKRVESNLEDVDWNRSISIEDLDPIPEPEALKPVGSN